MLFKFHYQKPLSPNYTPPMQLGYKYTVPETPFTAWGSQ